LHPSNSSTSIKAHPMAPTTAVITNTPNTSIINRAKPYTLQGLVENLNELLAEFGIPHCMRYETKYGFEDILTVLDVCISSFLIILLLLNFYSSI
jgi:hypothetical protein